MRSSRTRSTLWLTAGVGAAMLMLASSTPWQAEALPGAAESTVVSVTPARILDTRDPTNLGLPGPFTSPVGQKLQVTGSVPTATGVQVVVPTGATGVLMNVTSVGSTADGFISVRPGNASGPPTTSSLNFTAGTTTPNAVQVTLPTAGANAGQIDIVYDALGQVGPTTDVLIDVVGYTTNAGLQDLVTQLGQKANSADVYTRAQVDAAIAAVPIPAVPQAGEACGIDGVGGTFVVGYDERGAVSYKCVRNIVTTLAGRGSIGFSNGTHTEAVFNSPYGVAVAFDGAVYVADAGNNRIRRVTPTGTVTTLAGSIAGNNDGTGGAARFNNPRGVAVAPDGTIYVADTGNSRIRKVTPTGTVTTIAGSTSGFADGTGAAAQFNAPRGIAVTSDGRIYVADTGNQRIRRVTPTGTVTTIAGSTTGFAESAT